MTERLAVYTVAVGYRYPLPKTPDVDGVDYICFSDQNNDDPKGWRVEKASLILPADPFRSSRDYKVRPHTWLSEYSQSIYIDSTVLLKKNPRALWDHLIGSNDVVFGAFFHSFRATIADEFKAVKRKKLDSPAVLDAQRSAYEQIVPDILSAKPVWGGILARRHHDSDCIRAMETWFANILRYSRRDQLSLPLALRALDEAKMNIADNSLTRSPFHRWPVKGRVKPPYQRIEA